MNRQDNLFNERLLEEIAHLRKLQNMDIHSDRITHCLEMLRFIRNEVLQQETADGLLQENEWMQKNKQQNHMKIKENDTMDTLNCSIQKDDAKSALVHDKNLGNYYFVDLNREYCKEIGWGEYRILHQNYQRVTEDASMSEKVKSLVRNLQLTQ